MDEEGVNVGSHSVGSRKRPIKQTKRQKLKEKRYVDKDPGLLKFHPPCNHKEKTFACRTIPFKYLVEGRAKVYAEPSKVKQDAIVSRLIVVSAPKRHRSRGTSDQKRFHKLQISYKLWTPDGLVDVCQKFFAEALDFSHRRVLSIAKSVKAGVKIKEGRGGDRRSHLQKDKKEKVRTFLRNLKAKESHYNRSKSRRLYMSSEWNVRKLWKKYNASVDEGLKVKQWMFRKIFNSSFNIGFGSPATDICSLCCCLKNQIKIGDAATKVKLMTEYRVHKMRASHFHKLMNEKSDTAMTFCFDLQQVQNLPKLPIGEAFYARQLAFYALCVTDISSKNPVFYTWTENLSGRGANEIASGLHNFLKSQEFPVSVDTIRLFADGCGGQNKNSHMVHSLVLWLNLYAPPHVKNILLVFPVRGHSFLPADRVFGRVEKELRAHAEILLPEKYIELYGRVGEVKILGTDWEVYDFKSLTTIFNKLTGIKDAKRIYIKKSKNDVVQVKSEVTYRVDDITKDFMPLLKRGKKRTSLTIQCMPLVHPVKKEKLKDVDMLLKKSMGENWRDNPQLEWYQHCIDDTPESTNVEDHDHSEEECDCTEDDVGVRV